VSLQILASSPTKKHHVLYCGHVPCQDMYLLLFVSILHVHSCIFYIVRLFPMEKTPVVGGHLCPCNVEVSFWSCNEPA